MADVDDDIDTHETPYKRCHQFATVRSATACPNRLCHHCTSTLLDYKFIGKHDT